MNVERSHWRDQEISERHRLWSSDCPAADVDFLLVEFNHFQPCALLDYKKFKPCQTLGGASIRVLRNLADGYGPTPLPFAVVFYRPTDWTFWVLPENDAAEKAFAENSKRWLSEIEFVGLLLGLRNRALSANDAQRLEALRKKD
jgi:hypothetical protein